MSTQRRNCTQLAIAIWSLAGAFASYAACDLNSAVQVETVRALPPSLVPMLSPSLPVSDGMADRGEPFNSTDVEIREKLPMRRFHIAAVTQECVVVAFEQGGRGYNVQIVTFVHVPPDGWRLEQSASIYRLPNSLAELRAAIAE